MILKRSYAPEMMDDFSIKDERIVRALDELKNTNKYLGGISTTSKGLELIISNSSVNENKTLTKKLTILDLGSGASDILLYLKIKLPQLNITGIDLNKGACKYLKINSEVSVICGDTFNLPVKNKKFDIVHLSLFLHHFKEDEIKAILKNLIEVSRKGIIINDLRRSVIALAGIKIIASLFSRSELYKNDAPQSVKRGFIKNDWMQILGEMGINNYVIKRKWAFRWLLVIYNE
ncbi:MAG TPA: methyltransferase domain-containing protein [Ignavibacteriaceae bacterium]|nr:methyltransferase domain-containing protein [Ignavibacteriaceae bacterium]